MHGIVPPLVTPLTDRDQLDHAGLERLVDHVIEGGVHGLFILGTTGEAPSLSYRLRRELIDSVCRLNRQRVPVLVGITDTSYVESLGIAQQAAESGATAVVLATPYYFPAGQTELTGYVQHLAADLPLPLILYNMPSLTKVWFEIETLRKLSSLEKIIGIKDSSGDLDYFRELVSLKQLRPDWFMMMGPESLLPQAMSLGGDGGVNGGANIFPKLFVGLYNALCAKDEPTIQRLTAQVDALQQIYEVGKYASRFIKATKCALSLRGICNDFMAEPFHHFLPPERQRVATVLESMSTPE